MGNGYDRIVFGEEQSVIAEAGGEALLIIGRVDEKDAADNLPLRLNTLADAGRGIGRRPAAAMQVSFLEEGIAEGIVPVSDGENLNALVFLIIIVHVAIAALGFDGQGERVVKR